MCLSIPTIVTGVRNVYAPLDRFVNLSIPSPTLSNNFSNSPQACHTNLLQHISQTESQNLTKHLLKTSPTTQQIDVFLWESWSLRSHWNGSCVLFVNMLRWLIMVSYGVRVMTWDVGETFSCVSSTFRYPSEAKFQAIGSSCFTVIYHRHVRKRYVFNNDFHVSI